MDEQQERQILMLKGLLHDMSDHDQQKVNQLKSKLKELADNETDDGVKIIALTLFYADFMKSI